MNTLQNFKSLIFLLTAVFIASCAVQKTANLTYVKESLSFVEALPELDVYQPKKSSNAPVVIFIHGGYWDQGKKEIYKFLGRGFAKKEILTVIPNYTLSPNGNYNTMALEVAAAIKWTYENISKYNGNPDQIYLMGHSAGGHLISLVGTNPKYLENKNWVKGIVLNDAAGLDMYSYLKKYPPTSDHHYDTTWTNNPDNWKDASPIYFLTEDVPPFLIFVGTKTFSSILTSNDDFAKKVKPFQPNIEINYQNKKHVAMMSQYFFPWNKCYNEIAEFIFKMNDY